MDPDAIQVYMVVIRTWGSKRSSPRQMYEKDSWEMWGISKFRQGQVIPECGTRSERDTWQEMGCMSRCRFLYGEYSYVYASWCGLYLTK